GADLILVGEEALGDSDLVTDFQATGGAGEDRLDLSALLGAGSFGGGGLSAALLGGYLATSDDGTATTVTVDLNGATGGSQVDYTVVLTGVAAADLADNIIVD